jgi:hypothetical protein
MGDETVLRPKMAGGGNRTARKMCSRVQCTTVAGRDSASSSKVASGSVSGRKGAVACGAVFRNLRPSSALQCWRRLHLYTGKVQSVTAQKVCALMVDGVVIALRNSIPLRDRSIGLLYE